jgi:hypothetical protein
VRAVAQPRRVSWLPVPRFLSGIPQKGALILIRCGAARIPILPLPLDMHPILPLPKHICWFKAIIVVNERIFFSLIQMPIQFWSPARVHVPPASCPVLYVNGPPACRLAAPGAP